MIVRESDHAHEIAIAQFSDFTREQAEANANLIAAAPELYEALALLLTTRSHPDADRRVTEGLQKGLGALAKARGEEP